MLVEARRHRRAARAYLANGGSMARLREATVCTHAEIGRFLRGELGFVTQGKAKGLERLFSAPVRQWLSESRRYEISVGQIPTELIAPVVEQAFVRHGREKAAVLANCAVRQLFAVVEERHGVYFDIADRIVVRLESPSWWLENDERRRWYFGHDKVLGRFSLAEGRASRPSGETSRPAALAGRSP